MTVASLISSREGAVLSYFLLHIYDQNFTVEKVLTTKNKGKIDTLEKSKEIISSRVNRGDVDILVNHRNHTTLQKKP